jgi:cytoskeletal protein CcmA (bactofilin family)
VIGSVIAEDIVVRGRVVGSVRGLRVTLQAQSHVEGDIFHQSLAIEQGAYFEGKSRRSDDPLAEVKTASPRSDKPAGSDKPTGSASPSGSSSTISTRAAE